MFLLAGIDEKDLASNVARMLSNTDDRAELEAHIAKKVTEHINTIWPDHRIEIVLRVEAGNCEIFVKDRDSSPRFKMDERSDGFKQFISILLTLSAENRKETLKNAIILLDEPEISLHPSSIRYLRDELLDISKNNIVIAASHSIFLVDKSRLDRHYLVKKEKEDTELKQVDIENPLEDEIIYEALGTSIYEILERNFIVFEGMEDKQLFESFTNKFKREINPDSIKYVSAGGADEVKRYTRFFPNKLVKGLFVLDSDKKGQRIKRSIIESNPDLVDYTFELRDLVDSLVQESTVEDLLPREIVLEEAEKVYGLERIVDDGSKPILIIIKMAKGKRGIQSDEDLSGVKKVLLRRIKTDLNEKTDEEIKTIYPIYFTFLSNLHKKIKGTEVVDAQSHTTAA